MKVRKNFSKLRSYKCYNFYKLLNNYEENNELINFLIVLDNIDLEQIRFSEKKELLKVLEFIFKNYRLHKINGIYLSGYTFVNKFCPFLISEREYKILEKILMLKNQLGGYYMNNYSKYYNIGLNYISFYNVYNHVHNKYHKKIDKPFDKTKPDFKTFPGEYGFNNKGFVDKKFYI